MEVGLCEDCRWARRVVAARGATYLRCARAEIDRTYEKYPRLPKDYCGGHEPAETPEMPEMPEPGGKPA